jgi:hypothetical protein
MYGMLLLATPVTEYQQVNREIHKLGSAASGAVSLCGSLIRC